MLLRFLIVKSQVWTLSGSNRDQQNQGTNRSQGGNYKPLSTKVLEYQVKIDRGVV